MDDEEAKRIWARAYQRAKRLGFGDYAEDFAQDVLVSFLKKKCKKGQLIDHAVIDAARKTLGRDHQKLKDALRLWKELEVLNLSSRQEMRWTEFSERIEGLGSELKTVALLYFWWGYTLLEVGQYFGYSEALAWQRVVAAESKLRKTG
jgi:DNA-directed RNA polymerase specialized sigma24 family protein